MQGTTTQPPGLSAVIVLWFGQLISLAGTGMTRFAMTIWIWQETGTATAVSLLWVCIFAPSIFLSPVAGALVDRWNRKKVMIFADLGAGLVTLTLLFLLMNDSLQIWHLFLATLLASTAEAFQSPAQLASITTMVSEEQLGRANGIMSMAQFGSTVLAPILAGILVAAVGINLVLTIDVVTFLFAVSSLMLLRVPQPPETSEGIESRGTLRQEVAQGFRYILDRPGLFHLLLLFTVINVIVAVFVGLINPLILARTAEDSKLLGLVLTINGIGGVLGGLLMGVWGGTKKRMNGVLGGMIVMNLLGITVIGLGQSLWVWAAGAFTVAFCIPIITGCTMAIWQVKVAPDLQGRVFGVMRWVTQIAFPLGIAGSGPLADYVFEPGMAPGGPLAPLFADLIGSGPGAGMSALMLCAGLLGGLTGLFGFLRRSIRDVETSLPDQVPQDPGGGLNPVLSEG